MNKEQPNKGSGEEMVTIPQEGASLPQAPS